MDNIKVYFDYRKNNWKHCSFRMTNAMDDITSEANRDGSSIGCSRCGQYLLGRFSTRWQKDGQTIGPISITLGIL